MATVTVQIDASAFHEFMDEWKVATAGLHDVPDYLWERMQGLLKPGGATRAKFMGNVIVLEPTPEALSILATLRALANG